MGKLMEKRFCDICEKPATQERRIFRATRDITVNGKRCQIVVEARFLFENHPTGYGGPPDLCRECAADLVKNLK